MRGLMGAKPPTVKLVTSRGWRSGEDTGESEQQTANGRPAGTHLGAARQHQVARLADEHAAVFHQLLAVQEGEASEQVADLPLAALQRKVSP